MKLYTKTGDKGETGIIGKRISKSSQIINSVGNLDELNASIGLSISIIHSAKFTDQIKILTHIQSILFSIGSLIAGAKVKADFLKEITELEENIDFLDSQLKPLQNFILPGGSKAASHIHLARTICRRVERELTVLILSRESDKDLSEVQKYINRLSDYLFVLARFINFKEGFIETEWKQ